MATINIDKIMRNAAADIFEQISADDELYAMYGLLSQQLVKVVRCEDCCLSHATDLNKELLYCQNICKYVKRDFYCADGKESDDADNDQDSGQHEQC